MPPKKYKRLQWHQSGSSSQKTPETPGVSINAKGKSVEKGGEAQPYSIIIAIDFGTTFSGVAWYYPASNRPREISDWPRNSISNVKVATVLAYNTKEPDERPKWGFNIPRMPKWQRVEWFKLLLNEDCTTTAELLEKVEKGLKGYEDKMDLEYLKEAIQAIPDGKSPVDLVTDYLKALFEHTKEQLGLAYPELKDELAGKGIPLTFYLTVPAIWDDKAKDLTKQAAIGAGLGEGGAQIHMISEPEAAAIYSLKDMQLTATSIEVGDIYVITDCGGGTVDLISYQVTAINPLQVKECTIGGGGLCGSTAINRQFEALVQDRIGKEAFNNMSRDHLENMRREFERQKCDCTMPPDGSVDDGDSENDITCQLLGQELRLNQKEVQELFHPTFEKIKNLVQQQVTDAELCCKKNVKAVVLVGGFGNSTYLRQWLQSNITSQDGQPVKFQKPEKATLAIVLGAVEHGVAMHRAGDTSGIGPCLGSMVQSRKARFHYGVSLAEPFDPDIHPLRKAHISPLTGHLICSGRMSWFVKKGEELRTDDPKKIEFLRTKLAIGRDQKDWKADDEVYFSNAVVPPDDVEDTKLLCKYSIDLTNMPRRIAICTREPRMPFMGLPTYIMDCSIHMIFQSASLEFRSECDGKVMGNVTKDFNHQESDGTQVHASSSSSSSSSPPPSSPSS